MRSTLVLLLALLLGLSTSAEYSNPQRTNGNQEDGQEPAKPFQSGQEYIYTYNGQISIGLGNTANQQQQNGQQKAVSRIEAQAKITFHDSQSATLCLQNIRMGQANKPIDNQKQVQPMGMFERKQVPDDKRQQLEMAAQFQYVNGVVGRINFQAQDPTWARNIKRSVLNLLQVNLGQQAVQGQQEDEEEDSSNRSGSKSFTISEITIEGNCKTTYTLNPDNQPGQQQGQQKFNVTKTINFQQCHQIADVAYGYQTQQQPAECARCQQPWTNNQQTQQQQPSAQCQKCDPKQIKQQQLSRSTMIRFVLQGKPQNCAIQRAELVSQYISKAMETDAKYPSGLQTIVAAQLVFSGSNPSNDQQEYIPQSDEANTLLFDNQWDVEEKRFYQLGDESNKVSPFAEVPLKVEQAQQIIRRLVQAASDKQNGIEFHQLTKLQRLVEIFRMCSVEELEQIDSQSTPSGSSSSGSSYASNESEQKKGQQLVANCLAMAGTRNTIQVLSNKITNANLDANQAFQALSSLQGLPAPSDHQVEIVQRLCQHQAVHQSSALKQTCWLTFGSMVSELCQEKTGKQEGQGHIFGTQTGFQPQQEQCRTDKKETYKQALVQQYDQAEKTYEKVLALKAIGNAGLENTISHLENIIVDGKQERTQRCQAIDALRRLRTQMPRKIQRTLLPIYQNTKEHPEVRMAAFSIIMRTLPQQQILDQISYTLTKERQPEVQSWVYTTMKTLSKSKVPEEQNIAKHLRNTLKLAQVDEQSLRPSRIYQVPIYSQEQKEGVFLNLVSAYRNSRSQLPSHLAVRMDTLLNSHYQFNSLKVSASQQNIEKWYETLLERFMAATKQVSSKTTRGHRNHQSKKDNKQELRDIFSVLNIHDRRADSQQGAGGQQDEQSFAMVCVRVGDVDQAILPIDEQTMPDSLKSVLVNGDRPNLSEWMRKWQDTQHFHLLTAMNIKEKTARIPTSMGVPLTVMQAMPLMALVQGSLDAKVETNRAQSSMGIKAQLNIHPSVCMASIQKMEIWLPIFATGVDSTQAVEMNLPIQAEINADQQQGVRIAVEVPQNPRTQVFGAHSLPSTYTREWDERNKMMKDPKVKAIHYPQLEQSQQEVQMEIGKQFFNMPFHVSSQYHWPTTKVGSYHQLIQMFMATENHLHLSFEPQPNDGSPKKMVLQANAASFRKVGDDNGPELGNFYSDAQQFQKAHPEDNFEDMQLDGYPQRRQKLNIFLNSFQPGQMYQHSLKLEANLEGGRKPCHGMIELKTACDAQFNFCKSVLDVERSPLPQERQEWRLRAKMQMLQPQPVNHVEEMGQGKHQKLICQLECDWGTDHQQNIHFRVQGEQAMSRQQRQQQTSQLQKKQSAFLNKFDLVAEYKLQPAAQNTFLRALEMLKCHDPWNTQSQQHMSGKDGQVHATMVIDPIHPQQANISISTPSQKLRMEAVEMNPFGQPLQMRPFALVRPANQQSHSAKELFKRMAVNKAPRAKCTVDGQRVETFDGVLYKAPIGQCYSLLSKDCSSEPRFAVMMKAIGQDQGNQDKKIKVVTAEQTIECAAADSGSSKKLECYVNGQLFNPQQQFSSESNNGVVEFNNQEQTDVSIQVEEGVQARMSCWCSNCKCQKIEIRLSQQYKQGQCGLCGHYDDQAEDENELRMSNNQNTNDLAEFHRSYSFKSDCSNQEQEALYSNQNKNNFHKVNQDNKKSNYNSQDSYQQGEEEEDNDWQQGAYQEDSQYQDNQWEQQNQEWNNQQGGNRQQQNQEEPIEQTKVLEFTHEICFSVKPVKQCPEGRSPASGEEDSITTKKVQFACLSRGTKEAHQLQRQARRGYPVKMPNLTPSFVEAVQQPTRCVAY